MMEGKTQSESKGRGRQHSTSAAHLGGTDLETWQEEEINVQ